jgi:hypothetical protein
MEHLLASIGDMARISLPSANSRSESPTCHKGMRKSNKELYAFPKIYQKPFCVKPNTPDLQSQNMLLTIIWLEHRITTFANIMKGTWEENGIYKIESQSILQLHAWEFFHQCQHCSWEQHSLPLLRKLLQNVLHILLKPNCTTEQTSGPKDDAWADLKSSSTITRSSSTRAFSSQLVGMICHQQIYV